MKQYFTKCLVCKKEVLNFPSRKRKFCSYKCSSKIRSELKNIKCEECGKDFKQNSPHQERCGNPIEKTSCSHIHKRNVAKDKSLVRRYKITRNEYNDLLKKQNLGCSVCNKKVKLVVDHCHKTNKVRGLLCHHCNTALGMFQDSVILLERAKNYLAPFCL